MLEVALKYHKPFKTVNQIIFKLRSEFKVVKTRTSAFDLGIYILISEEFAFSQKFYIIF